MTAVLVGIDIGTSSVKASAYDAKGFLLAKSSHPVDTFTPQPGWAEQEPVQWWEAVCAVLRDITRSVSPGWIAAVGLSGQCPGHVLVDAAFQPVGRAIIWSDRRAVEEAAWLKENISDQQAEEWVGSTYLGDPSCPPARLLWLIRHHPNAVEKSVAVLQPKDFIALRLTGEVCTDILSAYCLAHPQTQKYAPGYFEKLGFPVEKMPPSLSAVSPAGTVSDYAARQTGLTADTPVVIGTIDAYCDNLAGGVLNPGRAVDVAGTSEIVSLAVPGKVTSADVFSVSLDDSSAFLCNPLQSGGNTLAWLAGSFYPEFGHSVRYDLLEQEAQTVQPGCGGLVCLPYLNGERAPIWDSQARGAFLGVSASHSRKDFTRAVYESIAFAIRHTLDVSEGAAGFTAQDFVICGGGSRSHFWNQLKADVLQRQVIPTADSQTGCLGAAIIASVKADFYPDLKTACSNMIQFKNPVDPNPARKTVYEEGYHVYRVAYPALKPVWGGISAQKRT